MDLKLLNLLKNQRKKNSNKKGKGMFAPSLFLRMKINNLYLLTLIHQKYEKKLVVKTSTKAFALVH